MKLYILPAYKETIRNQGYGRIIKAAEDAGYSTEVLNLQIQNKMFADVVSQGLQLINNDKHKKKAILGFSTGALIAYQISTQLQFEKAFFCSISPLLEDDIPKSSAPYIKYFGKETVNDLKNQKYGTSQAKSSFFFTGDSEGKKLINRTKILSEKCNGTLVVVKNNDHELNTNYVKQIACQL